MDTIIFFISVFLAGILSFFSPCILPLLPVYAGVLLDDKDGAQASSGKFSISLVSLLRTLAFIIGISFVFILLGYGAGFLGNLLYASWFQYVTGAVIIWAYTRWKSYIFRDSTRKEGYNYRDRGKRVRAIVRHFYWA